MFHLRHSRIHRRSLVPIGSEDMVKNVGPVPPRAPLPCIGDPWGGCGSKYIVHDKQNESNKGKDVWSKLFYFADL